MTTITFPLEVVEYLATFLCDDFKTLQAYTLACQAWNALTRPYLFRRIVLGTEDQLSELESHLDEVPNMGIWIRELCVRGHLYSAQDNLSIPWIDRLPAILPSKLEKLHTIEIISMQHYWDFSQHKTFFERFSAFSSVKSLSFIDCVFPADVLLAFIHALPRLLDVHLHDIRVMSSMFVGCTDKVAPPSPCLHTPPRSPCLRSLRIHSSDPTYSQPLPEFLKWFTGTETIQTLRSVQIHVQSLSSLKDVGSFLCALGPALRDLDLQFAGVQYWGRDRGYAEIVKCIDLSHNTGLEDLNLHNPRHPAVPRLLSQIASPHIRRVTFAMSNLRIFKGDEYDVVQAQLSSSIFSTLQDVCVVYSGPMNLAIAAEQVRKVFRVMADKNILRVIRASPMPSCAGKH